MRGILFDRNNDNVTISGTTITDTGDEGITFFSFGNDNVTIANTTITDAGTIGIFIRDSNVTISDTTITDAGSDGILISTSGLNSTVTLNDSILAGTFGGHGIQIFGGGNTFSGGGNTAAGATFGGQFCEVTGMQNGSFAFVNRGVALPTPGTCPP
jgi:hypothetical protein